jgi:ribosomal protein S18 acetylase RimI-like enzyme
MLRQASPAYACRSCQSLGLMSDITIRLVEAFPEPGISALRREVFADFEQSALLAQVLASESALRDNNSPLPTEPFRVAAFRGDVLVGWTYGYREGTHQFCMLNSGVAAAERRKGIYTQLVQAALGHAKSRGYVSVTSRHVPTNSAVLIAKLRLGFQVSGFEYSEVYGPLVRLTYLVGAARRKLYASRAVPLRSAE